ncbi:MAG: cysteine desulfurase-like protein [Euzebya sp.]
MTAIDPTTLRTRFPALVAHPDVVHTCAPGGTQILDTVLDAMRDAAIQANANQHASFDASGRVDALCDHARLRFGQLLGSQPEGIVFGPNMTTLTFHLSHALDELLATGGEIVCTRLDHDANVAPWLALAQRTGATVRWIDITPDGRLDPSSISTAITPRTRLVTLPLASNALGTVVDPTELIAAAKAVGALTVMDAVHGAPHVPIDRRGIGVDVVLCSPYKFFGPHAGVMAADPELLARFGPDKVRPSPDSGPERWQTGTASFETIAGCTAAAAYLLDEVTLPAISEHEQNLSQAFLEGLSTRPDWTLHGPPSATDRTPTFAVTHAMVSPDVVAAILADHNINVYAGHYYAVEPMTRLGLFHNGGAVRIGFVHYHSVDDVNGVLAALDAVTTAGTAEPASV